MLCIHLLRKKIINTQHYVAVMGHTDILSNQEAEGRGPGVEGQPGANHEALSQGINSNIYEVLTSEGRLNCAFLRV